MGLARFFLDILVRRSAFYSALQRAGSAEIGLKGKEITFYLKEPAKVLESGMEKGFTKKAVIAIKLLKALGYRISVRYKDTAIKL